MALLKSCVEKEVLDCLIDHWSIYLENIFTLSLLVKEKVKVLTGCTRFYLSCKISKFLRWRARPKSSVAIRVLQASW